MRPLRDEGAPRIALMRERRIAAERKGAAERRLTGEDGEERPRAPILSEEEMAEYERSAVAAEADAEPPGEERAAPAGPAAEPRVRGF